MNDMLCVSTKGGLCVSNLVWAVIPCGLCKFPYEQGWSL